MKKINWQIFISFNLLFSFLLMLVSGIILYFKPEGSVARWLDWKILFLSKSSWESVHTIFSFLFMIVAFFHIIKVHLLNFFVYLNKKHHYALKEFFLSLVICVIILVGTTLKVQPFQSVYNLGNQLSNFWEQFYNEPDEPVSVSSKLEEVTDYHYLADSVVLRKLQQAGYSGVEPHLTLNRIASKNDVSPQQLYAKITDMEGSVPEADSDNGHTITIEEIAFILKIDLSEVISFIENKPDIDDITPNTALMEICNKTGTSCSELRTELFQLKKDQK